jgi:uncharacterized membrane-anchored protein
VRTLDRWIGPQPLAAKVPEVTMLFWVIKLLTTAAGEATSDYLSLHSIVVAGAVELLVLVVAFWWQLHTRRYFAPPYWFLALAIAISGTGAADVLHKGFKIPYAGTSVLWAVVLATVFWTWNRSEHTLSIHSITTRRRELFYWAVVFATFALGTALGDFTATALGLGYLASIFFFAAVIMIPAVGWRFFRLNEVLAFWFAYVVTRPLGASVADYLSKPHALSGANYGDALIAVVMTVPIVLLVAYLTVSRMDIQPPASSGQPQHDDPERGQGWIADQPPPP